MKLFVISFLSILFMAFIGIDDVHADGWLYGKVFMEFEGRQFPLKGVFINKVIDCNKVDNKNICQSQSCLGSNFCPSLPQSYYTKDDGKYDVSQDSGTLIKNNQPAVCRDGVFEIACGINCGLGSHQFSAYFPTNYALNNFPAGLDFRKGHFEAATPRDQLNSVPTKILTDQNGNQYYHLDYTNNSSNNPDLDFEWIPDPFPIAGKVTRSDNGQPAGGVEVVVIHNKQNGQVGQEIKVTTDNNTGRFKIENVSIGDGYAVRIPDQANYKNPKTTTDNWSFNAVLNKDQPLNSPSYEQQQVGTDDCSGSDKNIPRQAGRCNFKVDAAFSAPPVSSQPTTQCRDIPVNNVLFRDILLPLTGNNPISINLGPPEGLSTYIVPVAINLDNACSYTTLQFKYISTVTTPSSPDPILCAKATGRPDSCACTLDNQCQGQKCDQNRQVCFTEAFIRTEGGDVHSNVKIEQ